MLLNENEFERTVYACAVTALVLLHSCFFARCDEFLGGLLQLVEDGYAGAIHGQNRSDRKSAVRRDLARISHRGFSTNVEMSQRDFSTARGSASGFYVGFKGLWRFPSDPKLTCKTLRIRRGPMQDSAPQSLYQEA
jgi:hypothetical protein